MNSEAICETCEFARIDEETGDLICDALLDEDDMADFIGRGSERCRFYRFYDEYKTVQKQN